MNNQYVIRALGDSAFLIRTEQKIDITINRRIHALAASILSQSVKGILDVVPAYADVMIRFEPGILAGGDLYRMMQGWIHESSSWSEAEYSIHEIPVRYGDEDGPDLDELALHAGISTEELVRRHAAADYFVYMLGFTPGFGYLGGLDPIIHCPRKKTPRTRIPAGSVGIAGAQTGIYPVDSPGGWQIIGRTNTKMFDLEKSHPFLLSPGDVVRFIPLNL